MVRRLLSDEMICLYSLYSVTIYISTFSLFLRYIRSKGGNFVLKIEKTIGLLSNVDVSLSDSKFLY